VSEHLLEEDERFKDINEILENENLITYIEG
jgi:hypothetical protein